MSQRHAASFFRVAEETGHPQPPQHPAGIGSKGCVYIGDTHEMLCVLVIDSPSLSYLI